MGPRDAAFLGSETERLCLMFPPTGHDQGHLETQRSGIRGRRAGQLSQLPIYEGITGIDQKTDHWDHWDQSETRSQLAQASTHDS